MILLCVKCYGKVAPYIVDTPACELVEDEDCRVCGSGGLCLRFEEDQVLLYSAFISLCKYVVKEP